MKYAKVLTNVMYFGIYVFIATSRYVEQLIAE